MPPARRIRFIRGESGAIAPDVTGKLPGHGAWLIADRRRIERAISSSEFVESLSVAFNAPVLAPLSAEDFADMCDRRLRQRIKELLGLECRAGRLFLGVNATRGALKSGAADNALLATDAASNSVRIIESLLRGRDCPPAYRLMRRDEIGGALGRESVSCVAFDRFHITTRLPEELLRLAAFRGKALPGNGSDRPDRHRLEKAADLGL